MTVEMMNSLSMILALAAIFFVLLAFFLFFSFQLKKTFRFAFIDRKNNRNVKKSSQNDVRPEKEVFRTKLLDTVQLTEEELAQDDGVFEILQDISFTYRNQ